VVGTLRAVSLGAGVEGCGGVEGRWSIERGLPFS
jgi:hypothetical protein